jgi:hypothetical protein
LFGNPTFKEWTQAHGREEDELPFIDRDSHHKLTGKEDSGEISD